MDTTLRSTAGRDTRFATLQHSPDVCVVSGFGMVGTGATPEDARRDLLEKYREAGMA